MSQFLKSIKGALKSKTVWFNIVSGAVELASISTGLLPPGTITVITTVGNIALRFMTNTSLADKIDSTSQS